MLKNALFQAQRVGVILVIVVNQGEAPIAIALIQGNGRRVIDAHFQAQIGAIVLQCTGFDALEQLFAQTAAPRLNRDRDRIQARQRRTSME